MARKVKRTLAWAIVALMALLAPLGALADTKHVYNLQDFLDAASDKSFNEIVLHTDIDLTGRGAVHFAANDPGSPPPAMLPSLAGATPTPPMAPIPSPATMGTHTWATAACLCLMMPPKALM